MTTAAPERLSLLLLEDDPNFGAVVEDELGRRGIEVTRESSVAGALERLHQKDFDVALLDLQLPDGSGLEVLREISAGGAVASRPSCSPGTPRSQPRSRRCGSGRTTTSRSRRGSRSSTCWWRRRPRRPACAARTSRCGRQLRRHEPVQGFVTQDPAAKQVLATARARRGARRCRC